MEDQMATKKSESPLENLTRLRGEVATGKRSVSSKGPAMPDTKEELARMDHAIKQIKEGGGIKDA